MEYLITVTNVPSAYPAVCGVQREGDFLFFFNYINFISSKSSVYNPCYYITVNSQLKNILIGNKPIRAILIALLPSSGY